jgi:hypothetical protein
MTPTPAPNMLYGPVICAPTIDAVNDIVRHTEFAHLHLEISWVVRDGPWALIGWGAGESGGQSMYEFAGDTWCRVANGGGALGESDLISIAGPTYGRRLWSKLQKLQSK